MKIALFTETYIPNVNGVVAHIKTLKDGLEKLGHEVLVVTADKHARHHYIEDGVLRCPGLEIKRFYGFGAASPLSRKRMRMIAAFNPDVIHIHHEFGIGLSGIMAAKLQKKPLVYTLHTMYDQYIYYVAPRLFLRAATKFSHQYMRFIAQNANALTGPSQKCNEYFKRIGVKKELNLIPNSVDLDMFNPEKVPQQQVEACLQKHGIPRDCMRACFVGRLGKEKDVDVLLEFWAQTITPDDRLHLVVIGDGPEKAGLEQLARKLGIDHMVTFVGPVPHNQMPAYFVACDVYVTASLSEMNSISMLEGMASGLPTLQRYDELNADQIQSGRNGYLYVTAQEMADKLREIRDLTPEQLREQRERVRQTVVSRGSTELAQYMLGVYERAIATRSSLPGSKRYHMKPVLRNRNKL